MTKAEKFEAVMDHVRDARDEESARYAAKAALLHVAANRDLIARALRTDEVVQDISMSDVHKIAKAAVKDKLTRETERDFAAKIVPVLAAFREAMK